MLTPVLSEVMMTLEAMRVAGIRPTLRRLAEATERSAHSGLSRNIDMLVQRGFVIRNAKSGEVELIRTIEDEIRGEPASMDPIVTFIDRYQKQNGGVTPSYDEMCEACKVASKSGISKLLKKLIENGDLETPVTKKKGTPDRCLRVVKAKSAAWPGNVRDDEGKTLDADV